MGTTDDRAGFTLIEIIVAMTLMLFVMGLATNSFRKQGMLISAQAGRLEAQQTAQFILSLLDRELRLAGVGVADMQPILVQADSLALTFNADLVSNVEGDAGAVYIDTDADGAATGVWHSDDATTLPNSLIPYPDSTYIRSLGAPSSAETISFWLSRDSSSAASNEYVLWRRVNAGTPHVVATHVVRNPGDTVFQYFKADSAGALTAIPGSSLPLFHDAITHGMASDTGQFALVDSIVQVRVRMTVAFHDRQRTVVRRLDQTIRLMNAGLIRRTTCGEPPLGVSPTAVASLDTIGFPRVTVTWDASVDESSGEGDVERYALFKRLTSDVSALTEPFASIPAGSGSYTFVDTDVRSGEELVYGVAAQDCTPNSSSVATASAVTIP